MIPVVRIVQLASRELRVNRARTWLLVACVAVAVAAMTVVTQLGASAEQAIADDVLRTQGAAGTYTISVADAPVAASLSATRPASIAGSTGRMVVLGSAVVTIDGKEARSLLPLPLSVTALDPAVIRSMPNEMSSGRWLRDTDGETGLAPAVLTPQVADQLSQAFGIESVVGSILRLEHPRPTHVVVVGILEDGPLARAASGAGILVPLGTQGVPLALDDWARSAEPESTEVRLYVSSPDESPAVASQGLASVRRTLTLAGFADADTTMERDDTTQDFNASTRILALVLRSIGLIVLAVGVTAVGAVSASSLRERSGELALRRAMGASPRALGGLVLVESVLIVILGAVLGLALVVGVTAGLAAWVITESQATTAVRIDLSTALTALVATGALGVVVGLLPARRAARQNVMDVLAA